jgi:zinc D-Ala-D-Ala carboxypeptidase
VDDINDESDGLLPKGVTVFDGQYPAVGNLDPAFLRALREAATAAAKDGVVFTVNSGWRTPRYQVQLLRDAVVKYGSAEEAARWVATPERSVHVQGHAIDIGRANGAQAWLTEHGGGYGLFQIYVNEPWHYELRPEAIGGERPPMLPDPSHDPRLRP